MYHANCPLQLIAQQPKSEGAVGDRKIWATAFGPRRSASRGFLFALLLLDGRSIGLVAANASRAVKDRQFAIGVFVDPDLRLDEVMAVPVRRDLQNQPLVAHRVVVADDTVFLHAQRIPDIPRKRHKGGGLIFRHLDEPGVMLGEVDLFQKSVGILHGRDPPGSQFLRQTFLKRAKHAF